MYLSLPLPSTSTRTMTVTVFSGDGSGLPMPFTVSVLKNGFCKDLVQALGSACCLKSDEILLLAEVNLLLTVSFIYSWFHLYVTLSD